MKFDSGCSKLFLHDVIIDIPARDCKANLGEICHPMQIFFHGDQAAAAKWIDQNQQGRRNLTFKRQKFIAGRRYNRSKKRVSNPEGKNQHTEVGDQKITTQERCKTAEIIAKQAGIGSATM